MRSIGWHLVPMACVLLASSSLVACGSGEDDSASGAGPGSVTFTTPSDGSASCAPIATYSAAEGLGMSCLAVDGGPVPFFLNVATYQGNGTYAIAGSDVSSHVTLAPSGETFATEDVFAYDSQCSVTLTGAVTLAVGDRLSGQFSCTQLLGEALTDGGFSTTDATGTFSATIVQTGP